MHLLILMLSLSSLTSCASAGDWGAWSMKDVKPQEREWRICNKEFDGENLHMKGFCYIAKECRTRKTAIFKNEKEECRNLPLHCKWGDLTCLMENNMPSMTLKNR